MDSTTVRIFNIDIDSFSLDEFLQTLRKGGIAFTSETDPLMRLKHGPEFCQAYQTADCQTGDRLILSWVSHCIGRPVKPKRAVSGLLLAFCRYFYNDDEISIFFLGSASGVAKQSAQNINGQLERQMVIATHSPSYGFEKDEAECLDIIEKINLSKATVLAVATGAPSQEEWIAQYGLLLKHAKIIFAVDATRDLEAGLIHRAPEWISEVGLEWLYRLFREPERLFRRYLIEGVPFL